jgi:hypothetical protein
MWRINDDDFLGQVGHAVAGVNAAGLGWPMRPRKVEAPAEDEIWLAPPPEASPADRPGGKPA